MTLEVFEEADYNFFVIYRGLGLIPLFHEQVQVSLSRVFRKFIKMPRCADENCTPEGNDDLIQLASWQPWASHRLVRHDQGETYLMYGWSSAACSHFQNQ